MKIKVLLFGIILLLLAKGYSQSDEIYLLNGSVIKDANCWEEDGYIFYEKYSTVVKLDKNEIERVKESSPYCNHEHTKVYGSSVIILKNGKRIASKNVWENDNIIYYEKGNSSIPIKKKDIAKIGTIETTDINKPKKENIHCCPK